MKTQQKLWWTACAAGALTVLLQSPVFAQKAFLDRAKKVYSLTPAGRKQLARETREWNQTADLIAAFLAPKREA